MMQDTLNSFFSQLEPAPWLCYVFPVLALGILVRCAVSLLTFRQEPEVWAWLTTPDGTPLAYGTDFWVYAVSTADTPPPEQLAAAKTKADDLLDQWKNGDATADSFGELAKANSADEATKDNGGLNEDANRSSLDANLTDWLFAEDRQPGDAAVVEASDSSGNVIGYQILYVESLGEIQWKYQATTALRSDDYDKWYTEVEANYPAELTDLGKEIAASSSNQ